MTGQRMQAVRNPGSSSEVRSTRDRRGRSGTEGRLPPCPRGAPQAPRPAQPVMAERLCQVDSNGLDLSRLHWGMRVSKVEWFILGYCTLSCPSDPGPGAGSTDNQSADSPHAAAGTLP